MSNKNNKNDDTKSKGSKSTDLSNIPEAKDIKFFPKEKYYFKRVDKFYKKLESHKINLMIDIISGKNKISLRLLDWFVTRYAKKKKVSYMKNNDDISYNLSDIDGDLMSVHVNYKSQLRAYKKRHFDPFRRNTKFIYHFKKIDKKLPTTIGQLNFFKWSFENKVLEYIQNNYDFLSQEMIKSNKKTSEDSSNEYVNQTKNNNIKPKKVEIILSFE